jgi:ribonuclease HI
MKRLTDFPGFIIEKSSIWNKSNSSFNSTEPNKVKEISFNPFDEVKESSKSISLIKTTKTDKNNETYKKFENVLELKETKTVTESPLALFPQAIAKNPIVQINNTISPITQEAEAEEIREVPMIQPRSKEGGRLLYKYPNIPMISTRSNAKPKEKYYLLVGTSDQSQNAYLLQFDGGAAPNPGPAASAAVLWSPVGIDGKRTIVYESGIFLGKATNNIAEVQGLLLGLKVAAVRGARELLIEGDSELIVFQQIGRYKVSDRNLKVWWANIQAAMMDESCFDWIAIRQVPREQNERADSITKECVQRKTNLQRAS